MVLDNGDTLTLLSVDYGKRHTPPAVKMPAAATAGARAPRRGSAAFTSQNNELCVWFRRDYTNNRYLNCQFYLYDRAGTACVSDSGRNGGYGNGPQQKGSEIIGIRFGSFPRRQGQCVVRVQEYIDGAGQVLNEKRFVISNPARSRSFPDWKPETLPATKTDGDLSVTLTKLAAGADTGYSRDQDNPDDAINKGVEAVFQVKQDGTNAVNWQPGQIETSDATGNHQNGGCNSHWDGDNLVADYQYGLWPGEPWKLRVELAKQSGYDDDELWVVKNIPLEPGTQRDFNNWNRNNRTNRPFAETDLGGLHLKIYPAKQFTDVPAGSQPAGGFRLEARPAPPPGTQLRLFKITDDQTNDLESWNSGSSWNSNTAEYHYGVRNLDGVTNLIVSIAVQKSRFFEFTAKPEKP